MIEPSILDACVDRALAEDLRAGDWTTEAMVDDRARAVAHVVARSPLTVCGGDVLARVFYRLDSGLRVEQVFAEGSAAQPNDVVWRVEGRTRPILMAERTALNFAQRLCGIATLAHRYVQALPPGCPTRITDTRKTTPGLRPLERYAVRCGGAHNHRDNLGAGVLIKDNHIAAAGSVRRAIELARAHAPHTCRVEIEVESLRALDEALDAAADIVMLDNFSLADVDEAIHRTKGRAMLEASGNVSPDQAAALARAGIDIVSVGALTHSAPAADLSLELEPLTPDGPAAAGSIGPAPEHEHAAQPLR